MKPAKHERLVAALTAHKLVIYAAAADAKELGEKLHAEAEALAYEIRTMEAAEKARKTGRRAARVSKPGGRSLA